MTSMTDKSLNQFLNNTDIYTLRPAALEDALEIWTIMDICGKTMEQKEHFICDDLDYVKDILSGHGFGVAACDTNGTIVGNLLVKYPGLDEENLGYDVFVKKEQMPIDQDSDSFSPNKIPSVVLSQDHLMQVVHMDSACVHPNHRGHGLESRMIAFAETLVDPSKYCYSFATAAPGNFASLKSLERNGYQVMVTKEKYGGFVRCVMMKILT